MWYMQLIKPVGTFSADCGSLLNLMNYFQHCVCSTLQALLVCAKAVAAAAASGDGTATVTTRAKLLLSHLDQWATHHPRSAVAAISADDATADDALWLELQQVSWCPVLSECFLIAATMFRCSTCSHMIQLVSDDRTLF